MKTAFLTPLMALTVAGALTGCVSPDGRPDYTGSGALMGGASGAAIGAMADRGNPGAGALIGGAAGLVAGGLIGHSMDQQAEAQWRSSPAAQVAPPPRPPTSIADIEAMARAGVSDDVIVNQINSTRAVYHLDADTIIRLKNAGVSEKAIAYMINTGNTEVSQAPPPLRTETVVVAPAPGYVWVGGEWGWNGVSWVWIGGRWVWPPYPHAIWVESRWLHGPHGWQHARGHWR